MTFGELVEKCHKLSIDDLEKLIAILEKHARDKHRRRIAAQCRRAVADHKAGKTIEGVDALFAEVDKGIKRNKSRTPAPKNLKK